MAIEVRVLDLATATSEGFLPWLQLFGARQHLLTAHPRYWQSLENQPESDGWKFAFVFQNSSGSSGRQKRSPVGILPFRVQGEFSFESLPPGTDFQTKIDWLRQKRSGEKPKVIVSDDFLAGGGPVGNQPTATLMATFRYLWSEFSSELEWEFRLSSEDPSLGSRVETVLNQFPGRNVSRGDRSVGWVLCGEGFSSSGSSSAVVRELNVGAVFCDDLEAFSSVQPGQTRVFSVLPNQGHGRGFEFVVAKMESSRRLGAEERTYHGNDFRLISARLNKQLESGIGGRLSVDLCDSLKGLAMSLPGRLYVPYQCLEPFLKGSTEAAASLPIGEGGPAGSVTDWVQAEFVASQPSFWQKWFVPKFAGI